MILSYNIVKAPKTAMQMHSLAVTENWAAVVAAGTDRNLLKLEQENDPVLKEILLALRTPDKRLKNRSSNH